MNKKKSLFAGRVSLVALALTALLISNPALAQDLSVVEQDRIRIQAHLVEVEQELGWRDSSQLSEELRAERQRNLEVLAEYREAGEFPHNTHVPGVRPVFIDRDDRACAVGYLMIRSGWEEEARAISERENLGYLLEMESPEVEAWVVQSGLTAEEAAWIQPGYSSCYDQCGCEEEPVCGSDGRTYVNECVARYCGGVDSWHQGCCEVADEIRWSGNEPTGYPQTACGNDPNERAEALCPDDDRVIDEFDWTTAEEYDDRRRAEEGSCAAVAPTPSGGFLLVVMASLAFGVLRRRSKKADETRR